MNCTTYIFGELTSGYSQYPEDGSSDLFEKLAAEATAPSQVIVHRDGSLMYYVYIRKYDSWKYIGFAIVINGYYLTDIPALFTMFEQEMERLAETGALIHYSPSGELTSSIATFQTEKEEADACTARLQRNVGLVKEIRSLPPVDYSAGKTSKMIFQVSDNPSEIANASCRLAYTVVLKEDDYDTVRFNNVRSQLARLNKENRDLRKENDNLIENIKKVQKQKKQFRGIIWLLIGLLLCGLGILILYKELNKITTNLTDAQLTINEQEIDLQHLNHKLNAKRDSLRLLRSDLNRERTARQNLSRELDQLMVYAPFVVRDCSIFDYQLICDYYSSETQDILVTVEVMNLTTKKIWSDDHIIHLLAGDDQFTLELPTPLSHSYKYYVILKHNNKILLGKEW